MLVGSKKKTQIYAENASGEPHVVFFNNMHDIVACFVELHATFVVQPAENHR